MKIRPMAGNVFILPDWDENIQSSIIEIPEEYRGRQMPQQGKVVAMNGKRVFKDGSTALAEFKIGDKVVFKKHSGLIIDIDGQRLVQCKIHDIEAVIENV